MGRFPGWGSVALVIACLGCAQGAADRRRPPAFPDAGTPRDAAPPDAWPPDTGFHRPDAGPPDAGPRDAGPDAGPTCDESPCRFILPQCGCGADEGCYPDGSGSASCEPAGTVGPGLRCGGIASCRPGHVCVGSRSITFCHRLCELDSECTGTGSLCALTLGSGSGAPVFMCSASCDPTLTTQCPTGTGCHPLRERTGVMRFFTHCQPAGSGGDGATCTGTFDCLAGSGCVGPTGGPTTCQRYCVVGRTGCPSGTTCTSFGERALVGSIEYGVCI